MEKKENIDKLNFKVLYKTEEIIFLVALITLLLTLFDQKSVHYFCHKWTKHDFNETLKNDCGLNKQ